jgi:hypothetical protein
MCPHYIIAYIKRKPPQGNPLGVRERVKKRPE